MEASQARRKSRFFFFKWVAITAAMVVITPGAFAQANEGVTPPASLAQELNKYPGLLPEFGRLLEKMQNEVQSPKAGKVVELRVSEGQTVNAGEVLASVE